MCEHCREEKQVNEEFKKYEGIKGAHNLYKEVGDKPYDNISGRRFGKLVAIEPVGRNKKGRLLWLCKCDCSNKVIVNSHDLKSFHTTSCSCSWKEKGKKIEIGQKFGLLTVVENLGAINGKVHWRCVCDCHGENGNKGEVIVTTSNLNAGTKSCGCLKSKHKPPIREIKDLTGKQFENWLILSRAEDRMRHSGKKMAQWNCKCLKCGKEEIISGESLRNYPKKCECSRKNKIYPKNIEGNTYNYWTVIKDEGKEKILVRCKCGTEKWLSRNSVVSGGSKSCGCYMKTKEVKKRIFNDLTGQTFNYLTVLEELGNSKVRVRCKCGTEKIVNKREMKYGSVKSCGCLSKIAPTLRRENLEGRVFTRWTVIKDEGGKKVLCRCSCGTERWVDRGNLRGNVSRSCGCLQKEETSNRFIKDLRGMRFGRLVVQEEVGRDKHGKVLWKTLCDCGNTKITTSDNLLNGHTKSCNCLKHDRLTKGQVKPMIGKTFGRLTVIEEAYTKKGKGVYYKCKCSCGNVVTIQGAMLRSKNSRSCGCISKELREEFEDLSGRRFGKLVVIKRVPNEGRGHGTRFLCQCDCGATTVVARYSLISHETMSCGCINSQGEYKVAQILEENGIKFQKQKVYKDLRTTKYGAPKFDFYIPEGNYLIEYDGEQHFKYSNKGWNTKEHYEKVKARDELKNEYCKEKGIPLIRIPYTQFEELCIKDLKLETTKFRII